MKKVRIKITIFSSILIILLSLFLINKNIQKQEEKKCLSNENIEMVIKDHELVQMPTYYHYEKKIWGGTCYKSEWGWYQKVDL